MTYTPGPWSRRCGDSRIEIRTADDETLASVGNAPYWQPFSDEDEANAALIAAAPDLLEALKTMIEGNSEPNERGVWGRICMPTNAACTRAAAAIAKATERTEP